MSEKKEQQIAVKEQSPISLFQIAADRGFEPAFIKEMMELQERYEANEAKKAYHEAMAAFKSDPPKIEKNKHVKYQTNKGVTEYYHATLADVVEKVNAGLSKYNLSATWETKQENGNISVTCRITHALGHSEETTLTASPDLSGSKNPIQAIGSAIAYLERYTLLALTGLAAKDMDDDGIATGKEEEKIFEAQVTTINNLIDKTHTNLDEFLRWAGVDKIEDILKSDFKRVYAALKAKETALKKAKEAKQEMGNDS